MKLHPSTNPLLSNRGINASNSSLDNLQFKLDLNINLNCSFVNSLFSKVYKNKNDA